MAALVLALDQSRRPIGLVPVEAAVSRIAREHVEGSRTVELLLADETRRWRSRHLDLPTPLIVRWPGYVELPEERRLRVSRRALFARDGYRCQYCGHGAEPGKAMRELTLDHVKPAHLFDSRAEATTWDNVTTACRSCNQAKGGRLPVEAGMWPATTPKEPHFVQVRFAGRLNEAQRDYVRDLLGEDVDL